MSALVPDPPATIYRIQTARDPVLVVKFEGGGLISYLREDGTLMHTLNTSEGFHRKLRQLGVDLGSGHERLLNESKLFRDVNVGMFPDGRNTRYR